MDIIGTKCEGRKGVLGAGKYSKCKESVGTLDCKHCQSAGVLIVRFVPGTAHMASHLTSPALDAVLEITD